MKSDEPTRVDLQERTPASQGRGRSKGGARRRPSRTGSVARHLASVVAAGALLASFGSMALQSPAAAAAGSTVDVSPSSGVAGESGQVTFSTDPLPCDPASTCPPYPCDGAAAFFWDGQPLQVGAALLSYDASSGRCTTSTSFIAPDPASIGTHAVTACALADASDPPTACLPGSTTAAAADFTIVPQISVSPTSGVPGDRVNAYLTASFRAAVYACDCDPKGAWFFWDGAPIGIAATDLQQGPVGTGTFTVVRSFLPPSGSPLGTHQVTACAVRAVTDPSTGCLAGSSIVPPESYLLGPPITVSPSHGRIADTLTVTFDAGVAACDATAPGALFILDGPYVAKAPLVVEGGRCLATLAFRLPAGTPPGPHSLTACAVSDISVGTSCAGSISAYPVTYTVDPEPEPTAPSFPPAPTATPTPSPSPSPSPTPTPTPSPSPSPSPTPTPTPSPSPSPSAKPTPTPSARPTPTASAAPTRSPTPTPGPTAAPTPSPSPSAAVVPVPPVPPAPTPAPTAEPTPPALTPTVTATPEPTPSAAPTGEVLAAVGATNERPSGGGGSVSGGLLSAFAAAVPGPSGLDLDPNVILTNLGLTTLFVFLFALTTEIFNSTLDENREEIEGWWARLTAGPLRILAPVTMLDARLDRLSDSGRAGSVLHAVFVLAVVGFIYGFLSEDFGFNTQSLLLLVALMVGIGFITYLVEGTTTLIARRRHGARATVRMYGTAVVVAIVAVLFSKFIAFSPGLVYGFVASALILTPLALAKRDEAFMVLVPAFLLLIASLAAFVLLGPASSSAVSGGWSPSLVDTILAVIFIGGLESLVFTMLPLRFMDGAVVMRWSKVAWALVFGGAVFLWWQLLLNRDRAYMDSFKQTSVQLVVVGLVAFMATTGVVWTFFRFHARQDGGEEMTEPEKVEA